MRKMRMMIVGMAFVSVVGLISWPAISRDRAAATPVGQAEQAQAAPVVADPQGQTAPGMEAFQLKAQTAESECFEVSNPCGFQNCRSLGDGYSCFNPDTCCCRFKACV